jgi:hypothetical protein
MLAFIPLLRFCITLQSTDTCAPPLTSSHYSACSFIFTLSLIHLLLFLHIAPAIPLNVVIDLSLNFANFSVGYVTMHIIFFAALMLCT